MERLRLHEDPAHARYFKPDPGQPEWTERTKHNLRLRAKCLANELEGYLVGQVIGIEDHQGLIERSVIRGVDFPATSNPDRLRDFRNWRLRVENETGTIDRYHLTLVLPLEEIETRFMDHFNGLQYKSDHSWLLALAEETRKKSSTMVEIQEIGDDELDEWDLVQA